jgi:signal transduction histidine kinase
VKAFPIFHDSVVALFEDVTDMEEAERKLAIEKEEKEQALQAKATLLARVSHELRSPLNGIIGCTELLLREPERQAEYMNTIQQCSISLLNLVNDLLDYSKADAGKLGLQQQTVVLHQVIESSILASKAETGSLGVRAWCGCSICHFRRCLSSSANLS